MNLTCKQMQSIHCARSLEIPSNMHYIPSTTKSTRMLIYTAGTYEYVCTCVYTVHADPDQPRTYTYIRRASPKILYYSIKLARTKVRRPNLGSLPPAGWWDGRSLPPAQLLGGRLTSRAHDGQMWRSRTARQLSANHHVFSANHA